MTRQLFSRLVTLGEGTEDTRRRVLRAEDLLTLARRRLTRGLTAEERQKYSHRNICP